MDGSVERGLDYLVTAFNSIIGVEGRPFGSTTNPHVGVSDDSKGVQWNAGVTKETGEGWVGVNLEGMAYGGYWPIAVFIENEQRQPRLPKLAATLGDAEQIVLTFFRDAWQAATRPSIQEQFIHGTPIRLNELTEHRWMEILAVAYGCLDPEKAHRGRGRQTVTLSRSGQREMQVSPHLHVRLPVWSSMPCSQAEAEARMRIGFHQLQPIYQVIKQQSS